MKSFLKAAAVALAFGGMGVQADEASDKLDAVLAAQPEAMQARYEYRHPKETLEFFGVKPGMTVADGLSGEYYGRILLQYLGDDGALIGVHYSAAQRMIDYKGDEAKVARHMAWPGNFVASAEDWRGGSKADVSAYLFGDLPESLNGTVDTFLMVRALHHLNKNEADGGTLTAALADILRVLKPGGVLGVVQHRAPEASSDEWARGFNGYLKQSALIKAITDAGFVLEGTSEINANPKDQPTESDAVWRLPPSNKTGNADIGESDRMTLKFRKPE